MKTPLAVAAAVCLAVVWSASGSADETDDAVFPPSSEPYGRSYAQWEGAYQIWLGEIPKPENPLLHPASPRNCEVQGNVVFLAPRGTGTRRCTIPDDTAVAFGDGFWECSTAEGLGDTFRALRRCATKRFARDFGRDVVGLMIHVDGERVAHPYRWNFLTPGEFIDLPEDNFYGAPAGTTKSVTKGFFYILRPLEEGRHRVRFHGTHEVFPDVTFVWKLEVVDD